MQERLPTSPHVMIYKFPIPAISSITNRITGVGLFVGFSALTAATLASGPEGLLGAIDSFKIAAPGLVPVTKCVVGFPLAYHYTAGLRHMVWDYTAKGLETPDMESSSVAVLAISVGLTVALLFLSLPERTQEKH